MFLIASVDPRTEVASEWHIESLEFHIGSSPLLRGYITEFARICVLEVSN